MGPSHSRTTDRERELFNEHYKWMDRMAPLKTKADSLHPLKTGDHVEFPRGFYTHHGIVVSDQDKFGSVLVVDFNKSCGLLNTTTVSERSKNVFLENIYKVEHNELECFPADEVVSRIRRRIGTTDYNFLSHNCEHEAMWAKTGKMQSLQVNVAVKNAANLGMEAWKLKEDIDQFGRLKNAGAYRFTNDQSWSGDHERFPGCDDNYHDRPPMPTASNNYNLGRSATSSQPEGSPAQMYNRLINGGR